MYTQIFEKQLFETNHSKNNNIKHQIKDIVPIRKMKPAFYFSNKATTPNDSEFVYNILQAKDSLLDGEFPRVRLDGSDTESDYGKFGEQPDPGHLGI